MHLKNIYTELKYFSIFVKLERSNTRPTPKTSAKFFLMKKKKKKKDKGTSQNQTTDEGAYAMEAQYYMFV